MNDRYSADDLPRRPGSARSNSPWPVDLAHLRPFRIGSVEVRPATREVIGGERREVLEPRVMQVLVTLASARGEIMSRDDLIDACWEGRAVSDDALNRVLSRLRALARQFEAFEVETIIKVGYRLVGYEGEEFPTVPAVDAEPSKAAISRRALVAGGATAAALGAGAVLWRQPWQHRPPKEAVEFFRRGEIARRQGVSSQSRWGINFYEQAIRIDPLYSDAWGALALANLQFFDTYSEAETRAVPGRLRSAARRALELDPGNADAALALILLRPYFRNWAGIEADLKQFNERHRDHWLGLGRLSLVLFDVGRLDEGIPMMKRVLKIDPMLPIGTAFLADAMMSADRLQETDALIDQAEDRWPGHPFLWNIRYKMLIFNSRPQAAAAFVMDPDLRPSGMSAEDVAPYSRLARALDSRQPKDVKNSLEEFERRTVADVHRIPFSANVFALLGRPDLTFAAWERYFFNRGTFGQPTPIDALSRRYARDLFSQPMAPLRSDPRFGRLLHEIGLEAYWRRTETQPDYRRAG